MEVDLKSLVKDKNKEIRNLKKEIELLRLQAFAVPYDNVFRDELNMAIIEYVRINPGTTQNKLSKALQQGAYKTIWLRIKNLGNQDILTIVYVNKQKCKLYLNDQSILINTHNELTTFKEACLNLIDKILKNKKWQNISENNRLSDELLTAIVLVNQHVMNVYMMYFLLVWSLRFRDNFILLNRLYFMAISTILNINLELARKFKLRIDLAERPTPLHVASPVLYNMVSNSFLLTPSLIVKIICDYKKFDLHRELARVIDIVWRIGFPVFRYLNLGTLSELLGSANNVESTGRKFLKLVGLDLTQPAPYGKLGLNFKSDEHKADFMKILYELSQGN